MMDRQQQPTRRIRAGIKPHRLQHHPAPRRKLALRALRLLRYALPKPGRIKPRNVHPSQAPRRLHRAGRGYLKAPFRLMRPHHPQPQRIVMIEKRLQRRGQSSWRKPAGTRSSIA